MVDVSIRLSVYSSVTKLAVFPKMIKRFDAYWCKWSTRQRSTLEVGSSKVRAERQKI